MKDIYSEGRKWLYKLHDLGGCRPSSQDSTCIQMYNFIDFFVYFASLLFFVSLLQQFYIIIINYNYNLKNILHALLKI